MKDSLMGYCGLYCGGCLFYQKTQEEDPVIAKDGSVRACDGCKSNRTTRWCTKCEIKACNRNKKTEICIDCKEYPCKMIDDFINDGRDKYHLEIPNDMEEIRRIGMTEWIKKKDNEYYCRTCNTRNNWLNSRCQKCGTKLINGKYTEK